MQTNIFPALYFIVSKNERVAETFSLLFIVSKRKSVAEIVKFVERVTKAT